MRDLKPRTGVILSVDKAIRLFNQGDAKAFEFIYRSYHEFVHRICLRMLRDPVEAEDAAQDVFACVFCKINTFRGESAFSSWLYRLATNIVLMRFRRNKHRWIPLEECRGDDSDSCKMFGRSIETSKSQLHKAHLRLRKLLGGTPKKEISQDLNRSVLAEIANSSAKGMR